MRRAWDFIFLASSVKLSPTYSKFSSTIFLIFLILLANVFLFFIALELLFFPTFGATNAFLILVLSQLGQLINFLFF